MLRRALTHLLLLTAIWLTSSAHVGTAGPYGLRVLVRPPGVIPGLVDVIIRSTTPSVTPAAISVRPAFWRYGLKGAPPAEPAAPVAGEPGTFSTQLWIMQSGSYAFHVQATGAAGTGTLVVPVTSVATTASAVPGWLGWLLSALGVFLVLGLISIVGAATRDSTTPAGATVPPTYRRRARTAMAVAACLIVALLTGGWQWWNAVDGQYRRQLYKPLEVEGTVTPGDARTLTLRITDESWTEPDAREPRVRRQTGTPLIPDHGKLMHLFLIERGARGAVAHLHPVRQDVSTFQTPVPGVPAGTYWVFGEMVRESGFTVSIADTLTVPAGNATPNVDGDDAWTVAPAVTGVTPALLVDGGRLTIAIDGVPVARQDLTIRARVTNADGTPAALAPWLGMAGHAMVVRTDGQVFMHLHPMGTGSMAAQERLLRREAGDTVNHGEAQPTPMPMPGHDMSMMSSSISIAATGDVAFPVAFPSAGSYRVFVQVRRVGRAIETAAIDLTVAEPVTPR
jgi:hypothetical protein